MLSGSHDGSACRSAGSISPRAPSVWRERELLVLVLLVLVVYFGRLTDLTIRGEESRWARVAQEMIESGDFVVPRQQGKPFPDRPPLNSWAMILASQLTGQLNLLAIRLPAALATLLTTLAIYVYTRNFLSRLGALAAALAFATMGQVLQLGRMAESDALLTFCLAAALFVWHWGYAARNNPRWAWLAGYTLAALAGLAKGPQGPVYFILITSVYLCVRRDWQFLFTRWHAAGVAIFALVIAAWQLPFLLTLDASSAGAVWSEGGQFGVRFAYRGFGHAAKHLVSYPVEVFACMLPWAFLLPVLTSRWLRENLGPARPMTSFLLTACAVAFPTCWLPAETRARYFMSLYPCLAPLVGLVIERSWESREAGWWPRSWDRFLQVSFGVILLAGLTIGVGRAISPLAAPRMAEIISTPVAGAYVLLAGVVAAVVFWSRGSRELKHAQAGVMAVAAFMGLSYSLIVVSAQRATSNDPSSKVASVRDMIPDGERLVSFGPVHHLFAFYYRQPIELQPLVRGQAPKETTATYFCFAEDPAFPKVNIPFAWEPLAEISCERARSQRPLTKVVVGRRIPDEFASSAGFGLFEAMGELQHLFIAP